MKIQGASTRSYRVGETIKRILVEILNQGKFFDEVIFEIPITVSEVRMSGDLKTAIVYVIPMQQDLDKEKFIQSLDKNKYHLRKLLTSKINLKYSPNLHFIYDDSFDYAFKIEKTLSEVVID